MNRRAAVNLFRRINTITKVLGHKPEYLWVSKKESIGILPDPGTFEALESRADFDEGILTHFNGIRLIYEP